MYSKLSELNRIPLRLVFERFCQVHEMTIQDLWPMFSKDSDGPGLYDIRNYLLHGKSLPNEGLDAFCVATENLKWTLERMLLTWLAWPLERTDISREVLEKRTIPLMNIPEKRNLLREIFNK